MALTAVASVSPPETPSKQFNDDEEDCQVVAAPLTTTTSTTTTTTTLSEDGILVVSCNLTNANIHFPHSRFYCGVYPYGCTLSCNTRIKFCDKCYCAICDIPARDCPEWSDHSKRQESPQWSDHSKRQQRPRKRKRNKKRKRNRKRERPNHT